MTNKDGGDVYVYLTDDCKFYLLAPSDFEHDMETFQNVTGRFGERACSFCAFVRCCESSVEISFFNQMGGGIGDIVYDGRGISVNSKFLQSGTKFEYMLADFELCYCNIQRLRVALENCGLELECISDGVCEVHRIFDGDELLITIEKKSGSIRFENFLRRYSYVITEVE